MSVITLSDGICYLKYFLPPQLHPLFHGDIFIKNSIVEVQRFVSTSADDGLHAILLDVSVQSLECLPIGKPTAWKSTNKHPIEEEPVDAPHVKWKSFCVLMSM
jgi:hypothetical protein